jgi:hypothetical protein
VAARLTVSSNAHCLAETVLISGHARDTLAAVGPSQMVADDAVEPIRGEAPTGIEPVYTALQAAA